MVSGAELRARVRVHVSPSNASLVKQRREATLCPPARSDLIHNDRGLSEISCIKSPLKF